MIIHLRLFQLVVGFQVVIVTIESWTFVLWQNALARGFLARGDWLGGVAIWLLKTIGQVHGVEVVALLIGFVDLTIIFLILGR